MRVINFRMETRLQVVVLELRSANIEVTMLVDMLCDSVFLKQEFPVVPRLSHLAPSDCLEIVNKHFSEKPTILRFCRNRTSNN